MATRLKIENMKLADIKPYRMNAKQHPQEQIDQIKRSIEEFGFDDPIAIWGEENTIVEGHGRYLACKQMGIDEVPVIRLDHLTDEQRRAYTLIHNQLTMNSGFDAEALALELDALPNFDMGFYGFEYDPEETGEEKAEDDFYDPDDAPDEPRSKPGDVFILGNHRLMCGDSANREDVERLMDGTKANLFLTDPPYNVAIGSKNQFLNDFDKGGHVQTNILGDAGMTDEEIGETLWKPAFENARAASEDDCTFYMTAPQGGTHMIMMMMMMREAGWQMKHELVWVKNVAVFSLGRLDYDYKHEPILYGWNKSHKFYRDGYETSVLEEDVPDIDSMKKEEMKALLLKLYSEKMPVSVFRYDKPLKSELHPTMKPIPLFGKLISNSSRKGDVVLDLFGGSGTTMIACEQLGRRCFMMEHDPHYCDVIIDRWEKYTGEKAVREGEAR